MIPKSQKKNGKYPPSSYNHLHESTSIILSTFSLSSKFEMNEQNELNGHIPFLEISLRPVRGGRMLTLLCHFHLIEIDVAGFLQEYRLTLRSCWDIGYSLTQFLKLPESNDDDTH